MGLRRVIVVFYGTIFVLVVENVESISRMQVVVFDVTLMLFVADGESAAGLANIFLIACYARQ
jgi:hypothetical protein